MNLKELLILQESIHSDDYLRKIIPHIKSELFEDKSAETIFAFIKQFFDRYNKAPDPQQIGIYIQDISGVDQSTFDGCVAVIEELKKDYQSKGDYAIETTEEWCRNRSVYQRILDLIQVHTEEAEGKKPKVDLFAALDAATEARQFSFDNSVGHNLSEDKEDVISYLTTREEKVSTGIPIIDSSLNGGFPAKTLNCFLAATNVGKTLTVCALSTEMIKRGHKVLYVTLEMSALEIATRIHANLASSGMATLTNADEDYVRESVERSLRKCKGTIYVHEYPTAAVNTSVIKTLLNDLQQKRDFKPNIIFVDYLNLFNSERCGMNAGTYSVVKSIAEELRGIACIHSVPIVTATQANRGGFNTTDMDLTNTAESIGLPATVDWMASLTRSAELDEMSQILINPLKSRYSNNKKPFVVGVDLDYMRIYEPESSAQTYRDTADGSSLADDTFNKFNQRKTHNFAGFTYDDD